MNSLTDNIKYFTKTFIAHFSQRWYFRAIFGESLRNGGLNEFQSSCLIKCCQLRPKRLFKFSVILSDTYIYLGYFTGSSR